MAAKTPAPEKAEFKPDFNLQVRIGDGQGDMGAYHRAMKIGHQLWVLGRWPNPTKTRLIVHRAYDLYSRIAQAGKARYDPAHNVVIYAGIHDLEEGKDYEFVPLPPGFWRIHGLPDPDEEEATDAPE